MNKFDENDYELLRILQHSLPNHQVELIESTGGACWSCTNIKFTPTLSRLEAAFARWAINEKMEQINELAGIATTAVHYVDFL